MALDSSSSMPKPRSMQAGQRNVLRSNDSASLWNYTLSPGWTREQSETLRKALMKFGVGNWSKIVESDCLTGKTPAQLNLQTQRLLGQQSTAEFAGLHIDVKIIFEKNAKIQGPDVKRKNGCIVNTGAKLSREELRKRLQENKEKYEIPESEWKAIELPKTEEPSLLLERKREELRKLQEELKSVETKIMRLRERSRSATPTTPSSAASVDSADEERKKKPRTTKRS
ncbi:uncharacterized protein VTP21DRAFT_4811 [Calcarisporiella thermophila]|uniref:uncharacterized protein n=1 Tax=Calcarisporiella thermophila TaxID=911321 RepID=UPI00374280F8